MSNRKKEIEKTIVEYEKYLEDKKFHNESVINYYLDKIDKLKEELESLPSRPRGDDRYLFYKNLFRNQ